MHELQPAFLAGMGSVHVHRPWPPRAGVGPPHHHGPVAPTPPDSTAWPVLWARCWGRIRTWRVPPRWSQRDWCDEARAQGEATACGAVRDFDPHRLVPLDAFLYSRVVDAVWTRYRQEWSLRPPHPARRGDPRPPRPGTTRTRCRHTRTPGGRPGQPGRAGPRPDPPALLGRPLRGRSGPGMGRQPPGRQQA